MLISDVRGREEHYCSLRRPAVVISLPRNDIDRKISGLVTLATYIIAMISDKYFILSWDGPVETFLKRCDDAGHAVVGKLSGRKSAIIR